MIDLGLPDFERLAWLQICQELADQKAISTQEIQGFESRLAVLERRYQTEKDRLGIAKQSAEAQLRVQQLETDRLASALDFKRRQVAALQVRAGIDGVVQQLGKPTPLHEGQSVKPGTSLATIVQPGRLRVELNVPAIQSAEVQLKQMVKIDTKIGVVSGHVTGVAPLVQRETGTITVYVALDEPAPKGARPGMVVEARIELERILNALQLERPVHGGPHARVALYRVAPDGKSATKVIVKLGRATVSAVEVLDGLAVGDKVILSDMSPWDNFNRIAIE